MARVSNAMPVSSSCTITGSKAFSCNWPSATAQFTVTSMPKIVKQHWLTHSGITGFTLAGMIDDPAWRAGTLRSLKPQRGPELSSRKSSAAFFRCTARLLMAADVATYAPISVMAATGSGAAVTGKLVICARCLMADLRNRRSAQMPVPMAVAPRLSWASSGTTRSNAAKSDFNSVANAWNS